MENDPPPSSLPNRKIRYAIVGLGGIARDNMMPSVRLTDNSIITAFVTSDPDKARGLGSKYGVDAVYSYEQFPEALSSGRFDAIYIATPNWRHAEFTVPALRAGIHVLCEKPLDVSAAKCREALEVARSGSAKLMIAYRLHFEPATLATIDLVRSGKLGEVHTFTSDFFFRLNPKNHRARSGDLGGPVLDLGVYPVNAARCLFEAEPVEVVCAAGTRRPSTGFSQDFDDMVAVTLRFPGNRLAQFTVGYYGNSINRLTVIGSEGSATLDPAYLFDSGLEQMVTVGQTKQRTCFMHADQFAGEVQYFSRCILNGTEPEPNGEEGFADTRVLDAVIEALHSHRAVPLAPVPYSKHINTQEQKIEIPVA